MTDAGHRGYLNGKLLANGEGMFTGLIEEVGRVARATPSAGGVRLVIHAPIISAGVAIGDSVSINGACHTVVSAAPPCMEFDSVKETVGRSTTGALRPGDVVNLECALRAGDRLGGHMVQGHVDGTGRIADIKQAGTETRIKIEAPAEILKFMVEKGSIAVDGISLTVAEAGRDSFTVAVIPHTLAETTLGKASKNKTVNLETDIIGKYVYKFVEKKETSGDSVLLEKLVSGGFME